MKKKEQQLLPNPNSIVQISQATKIKGDIITESEMKFNGSLEGTITGANKLVLGAEGYIKGEINCKNAIIFGKIDGKIVVEEQLTITSTGQINGEVITSKLAVENGAIINGPFTMNKTI